MEPRSRLSGGGCKEEEGASVGGGGGSPGKRSEGFTGSPGVLNHHLHHLHPRGPSSSSLLWPEMSPRLQRRSQV